MTTQKSLQLVHQFYATIGSGDIEAILNLLAAVVGHFKVLVKATGRYYEPDTVLLWTVEDGKIKQFREFTDTTAAVFAFRGE